ncbi:hypothetical protein HDU77_005647 [Chytriomyces hyalinus]|nr:hypothetical protein HDU77_005647 [Chytriomyces hyalinus]
MRRMLVAERAVYEERYASLIDKIVTHDGSTEYHISLPADRHGSWKLPSTKFIIAVPAVPAAPDQVPNDSTQPIDVLLHAAALM